MQVAWGKVDGVAGYREVFTQLKASEEVAKCWLRVSHHPISNHTGLQVRELLRGDAVPATVVFWGSGEEAPVGAKKEEFAGGAWDPRQRRWGLRVWREFEKKTEERLGQQRRPAKTYLEVDGLVAIPRNPYVKGPQKVERTKEVLRMISVTVRGWVEEGVHPGEGLGGGGRHQ